MSQKSSELGKRFAQPSTTAANQRVARLFVPNYSGKGAISLRGESRAKALARRQLARLIEPRRLSS